MKRYEVVVTRGAASDLQSIFEFVREADSAAQADRLLDKLEALTGTLNQAPERGSFPKELANLGIQEYRQVIHKPYRIIYRIMGGRVVVYLVADGRRDMATLLAQRLFGAPTP
ncbi:MAG: type II toxin-antitoxin system RelE/ParE family toxin [Geothrix sp.]|nr:type II toxin-antitoxin system RelE/ParE family toxin [Geothrix sp.]